MLLIGSQYLFTNILRKQSWDVVAQAKVQLGVYNLRDVTSSSLVFLLMSFSGANGSL